MVAGTQEPRRQALDGLRGLAALGIVVLHVWMYDYADGGRPPRWLGDHLVEALRLGVPLFFALTGFLLYRPFVAAALDGRRMPRLTAYALRRAARVVPAYWAAVAVSFLLWWWLGNPHGVDPEQLPVFLLFAQNYSAATAKQLDPPMWTLVVEMSFYLVLPLVALCAMRLGRWRWGHAAVCVALIAAGALVTRLASEQVWPWTARATLLLHISSFACGMLAAALVHGRAPSARSGRVLLLAGWALVLGDALWYGLQLGDPHLRILARDIPAALGFGMVIAALSCAPVRSRLLTWSPVQGAGTVSYGIYLWHYIVIIALRASGGWPARMELALAVTVALTVPLALASWHWLELPAQRWARRATGRRRSAVGPARAPRPAYAET